MVNLHTCSGELTCGSCEQPHPGRQTCVGLLVPTHTTFCGTNHTSWITIYTYASPTGSICKTYWNNKVLVMDVTRSFTPPRVRIWPNPSPLCGSPLRTNPNQEQSATQVVKFKDVMMHHQFSRFIHSTVHYYLLILIATNFCNNAANKWYSCIDPEIV